MKNFNRAVGIVLAILAPSIVLRAVAMDILLPSMPTIAADFGVPFSTSQWILSVYFIGAGLGQLFVGPLSDEYGRRKLLIASTLVIILSSFLCALVTNINTMLLLRFMQGLGTCGTTVVTMAIVRDLYAEPKLSKVYSYLNSIIGASLLISPMIGGILLTTLGTWRSTFYFVGFFSVFAVLVDYFFVPETNPKLLKSHQEFVDVPILKSYKTVLTDPEYLLYCCCNIMGMSGVFLFFSMSSILLIKLLGFDPRTFSYYFCSVSVMYLLGTLVSADIQSRVGSKQTIFIGSLCMLVAGTILYWVNNYFGLVFGAVIVCNMLSIFGVGLLFGPCMAGVVKNYKHIAGIASAAYGAIYLGASSLLMAFIMSFEITDAKNMSIALIFMGLISCAAIRQIQKRNFK